MKVLIVKASALGDIIHALPVLDYLHKVKPGIEVDWVAEERFRGVLDGNPLIRKLLFIDTRTWRKNLVSKKTWQAVGELRKTLREENYDYVFDIQGNIKSGVVAYLTGAPRRLGFEKDVVQESLNVYFTTRQVPLRRQDDHITKRALRLVSVPFGRDYAGMDLRSDIYTTPQEDEEAEIFTSTLSDGLVFLFQPGTTWETKLWREERWVELARRVRAHYNDATILLNWGSDSERLMAERIASAAGGGVRLLPWLTIRQLVALLKKVDLAVGPDSGPIHLAAAVGTPTVSFYRATRGAWLGPLGPGHVKVQSPFPCTDCYRRTCSRNDECSESITTDKIWAGIIALLG